MSAFIIIFGYELFYIFRIQKLYVGCMSKSYILHRIMMIKDAVSVLTLRDVDDGLIPGQMIYYSSGICCFSTKHVSIME
jgi:hypothetical protein